MEPYGSGGAIAGVLGLDPSSPAGADAQLRRFERLRGRFEEVYERLGAMDAAELVREDWARRNEDVARDLLPAPPVDFIHHPAVLFQMFVGDGPLDRELQRVVEALDDDEVGTWLTEDSVGDPPLSEGHDGTYPTSSNLVHHAHHLIAFRDATDVDPADVRSIVEWGGGYGSLARLVRRLSGGVATYVLVDTPVFSALQWLYLSSIFGEEATHLVDVPTAGIRPGRLNVVPIGAVRDLELSADLFVSTWALNESAPAAQEHVVDRDWFGAAHLLMGMHDGEWLLETAAAQGAEIAPIGAFLPAQNYVLR